MSEVVSVFYTETLVSVVVFMLNCVKLNDLPSFNMQDSDNVSSWPDAYAIASNVAGDHPTFDVDYQSYFEPYAKWIWARRPAATEGLPPRRQGASSITGLNCAFCRADRIAKPSERADVRGK